MAKPKVTAESFLKNLTGDPTDTEPVADRAATATLKAAKSTAPGRAGLKHFGGYLGPDAIEKIAILRARLKKDNSELIEYAINELYNREAAARKFGDR
jgi:hypothetical protein